MHHSPTRRFIPGQTRKSPRLRLPIPPTPLIPPLHRHQRLLQPRQRRGRHLQRQSRPRIRTHHRFRILRRASGPGWVRRRDARSCEVGAFAADGVVEVLGEGVVDDADEGFEVVGEGEGDGDVGVGVHEVCGAVDRVHDEGWGGGQAAGCGGFFA